MATTLTDREGTRTFHIDANNEKSPSSVFIWDDHGFCMEFRYTEMVKAFKDEFGIIESLDSGLERFLAHAA